MKASFAIIITSVLLYACYSKSKDVSIPQRYINMNEGNFKTKQAVTYYDQQPFSGWQYSLFENGDTSLLTPFLDGKESGMAKEWYGNKQVKETRLYTNGKRTGEHTGWWENGQLKFIHHYVNDLSEGGQQEWYPDGNPYKELNYSAGYEKGLQKIWRPDGRLHANYEVRNGRNYGLTGTMHCKNIWKDGL